MRSLNFTRAQDGGASIPEEVTIVIVDRPSRDDAVKGRVSIDFGQEAHDIADALFGSLPGGTLDHLFAEFARRKASELWVNKVRKHEFKEPPRMVHHLSAAIAWILVYPIPFWLWAKYQHLLARKKMKEEMERVTM